ncbi:UDP-N-acetylmuramoyl-L-alanyl-D-glutamate--2,6-diaminopimelate ligase [Sporosarcina oncorhynchi]|uniref:UDP-N-acetylmuramoyl-L-alanyl-D-glutamate--2,6-diaminopimelate ligase n=1 Tax=Sporosarcina oncorhynchi TaxID=3056444 RepID=A0ABZ0L194_9BACL|nr:UDP-N-acetylmuramoyl-L-alanyl-D-glutamate--2,6-diaminopimelate ligase [Sporosarcina sp. T2O-4]WOV86220.1 UDP-N-acetylmuramoyl-L-alanyl-D-glutamate--2,6-diaminopimelate ligase [Sporosarcina sp. T2O-4]
MLLSELVKNWPCTVLGSVGVVVKGITEHSRSVQEGYIFVARKGACDDGLVHVEEAIDRGAVAVIIDRNIQTGCVVTRGVTWIIVPDGQQFISHASAKLAGNPSQSLTVIAVTGTNGKTTVTHFIAQLLRLHGEKVAVIGTTGIYMDELKLHCSLPEMTTLPAEHLHPLLKDCVDAGVTHVVLEASSLGLSTYRLEHCEIDIGVFLNIGVDHYDEHGSKEAYIQAKKRLTTLAKCLIVNADDEQCVSLVSETDKPLGYFNEHMILGRQVASGLYPNTLPGKHNKSNAFAAVSVLTMLGYDQFQSLSFCNRLMLPEGRLQRISRGGLTIFVDYAHTPDALQTVLMALEEEFKDIPITTVFGCGGNRDRGKRPQMGEVAATFSSKVIITSDNPRREDPSSIINDILRGAIFHMEKIIVEPDRLKAIRLAIDTATDREIILIAGKGHEKTQQIGQDLYHFSDFEVANKYLEDNFFGIRTE